MAVLVSASVELLAYLVFASLGVALLGRRFELRPGSAAIIAVASLCVMLLAAALLSLPFQTPLGPGDVSSVQMAHKRTVLVCAVSALCLGLLLRAKPKYVVFAMLLLAAGALKATLHGIFFDNETDMDMVGVTTGIFLACCAALWSSLRRG